MHVLGNRRGHAATVHEKLRPVTPLSGRCSAFWRLLLLRLHGSAIVLSVHDRKIFTAAPPVDALTWPRRHSCFVDRNIWYHQWVLVTVNETMRCGKALKDNQLR